MTGSEATEGMSVGESPQLYRPFLCSWIGKHSDTLKVANPLKVAL